MNLDVLGRRDPAMYGGISLAELESQIYEWAKELECTTRCRQTNHEGEYVDWCHDALDGPTGSSSTPARGRTTATRSATRSSSSTCPIVEVHLSNVEEREEWRRQSVIADLGAKRVVGKGPDGYREALACLARAR